MSTIADIMKENMGCVELVERILGYVWSMYQEVDAFTDDILDIADDMGITEEELVEMFHKLGFEEE